MGNLDRRRFCRLAIGMGGALGAGAAAFFACRRKDAGPSDEESSDLPDGLHSVTRTSWAMGADVSITALHADPSVARRAVEAALAEVGRLEDLLSLYRPDSQICRLNRDGALCDPHPDFVEVLRRSEAMSLRSQGAFDVTVQPLWDVYAPAAKAGQTPAATAIETARRNVGWRRVSIGPRRIELLGRGTAITLNGIAQGFAADRAVATLRRHGIRHALVNTGEIGSLGGKGGQEDWTVGIQHPRQPGAYAGLAKLRGRSLATSGDYSTRFSDDFRLNHIFDPQTGRSPEEFASVSIAAATACTADALSTAVFVLGAERGLQLVRATPGADALLIFKDGRTLATEGFPG